MQVRRLENSRTIIEIMLLLIAYTSIATGVYIGVAGKDAGNAYYCLIVAIPVLVTYWSRRHIRNYQLFIVINVIFVFIAAKLAKTDIELVGYMVIAGVIGAHSIRLKHLYVKRKQYEKVKDSEYEKSGYSDALKSEDDRKIALNANERLNIAYIIFMVIFYIMGDLQHNAGLKAIQIFLFVAYVLCQFVYNQIDKLYEIFIVNEGKSEFPSKRIMRINVMMMFVFGILMIIGMFIFYNGRYGNIFQTIRAGIMFVVKGILWVLLKLIGMGPDSSQNVQQETTTAANESALIDSVMGTSNPVVGNALMEVVGLFVMIGLFVAIIVLIVKYSKVFSKSLDNDKDEVEYLNKDTEKQEYNIKAHKKPKPEDKINIQYRKLYKKYAKSKRVMAKNKLSGIKPDSNMMPEEITIKTITDDEVKAKKITEAYEKARYSKEEVTKEDVEYLKKL